MIKYDNFGVLVDCSRNGVMKPIIVKRLIDYLARIGYNTLELYTEDTFRIPDEKYFGYLRGGYSGDEIKDIDAYAKEKGVELIPCVQGLAHFDNLVKLPMYRDIVDIDNILLVDEPKTYELIDKIFNFLAKNFTSRRVNVGMDEAHLLGLGKFLDNHGFQKRFDILLRHLNKVNDIALKYGFKIGIWSDMFFRLLNNGEYYGNNVDINKDIIDKIPDNVELIYWDYYHLEPEVYDKMLGAHVKISKEVWFAGGAWSWCGFAPLNQRSLDRGVPAFNNVIKHNIKRVLVTTWGDDGKECSVFALLPTLYAFRQFADGNFYMDDIKLGFKNLLGFNFDEFMYLDKVNCSKNNIEFAELENPCKSLLYNDCFLGVMDRDLETEGAMPFAEWADKIRNVAKNMGEFEYLFTTLSSLADLLAIKYDLGIRTRKAYKKGDVGQLKEVIKRYTETGNRLEIFYNNFKDMWFKENKPHGWEVQDARLGGLARRISSCKERLILYVDGKIADIPELEEEIYSYTGNLFRDKWQNIITTSKI